MTTEEQIAFVEILKQNTRLLERMMAHIESLTDDATDFDNRLAILEEAK